MTTLKEWGQRLGNPLNWPPGDKAFLISVLTAVLHLEYTGWTILVLQSPDTARFINPAFIHRILPLDLVVLSLSFLFATSMAFLRKRRPESVVHEYAANLYYATSLCMFSYLSGTLTMATGVVLAGAPILGFILFRPGPVLWSLGVATAILTVASLGAVVGWWPYAPAIAIPLGTDGQLSGFWLTSMTLFVVPHLAVVTLLSWYVLAGWRQREEATRLLSVTDPLTALPNRRAILAMLERERQHSRATERPLSIIMVDLDRFKALNDDRGHAAGDVALKETARRLQGALRQNDHVGRIGGEEFLVILPGADSHGAGLLAERCRAALENEPVILDDGTLVNLTASLGVYTRPEEDRIAVDDMLDLADQALYRAKQGGRNRVELAAAEGKEPAGG